MPECLVAEAAATVAFATSLAKLAEPGDIIALRGTLGTGKTVFARAFIRRLTEAGEEVPSPTFTLVQTYDAETAPVFHFDLYRIEEVEEVYELDIEDAFADGISLIEWPERMERLLPRNRLDVTLSHDEKDGARKMILSAQGSWAERLTRGCGCAH